MHALCLEISRDLFIEHLQVKSKVNVRLCKNKNLNLRISQDCNVLVVENVYANKTVREELFGVLLQDMQVRSISPVNADANIT